MKTQPKFILPSLGGISAIVSSRIPRSRLPARSNLGIACHPTGRRLIEEPQQRCQPEEAVPCPPVLKITHCVLIRLENSLLYMILQGLSRMTFCPVLMPVDVLSVELSRFYHCTPYGTRVIARTRTYGLPDYENTRKSCAVLKVFYSIQLFNRLQGWSSCQLCIRSDRF